MGNFLFVEEHYIPILIITAVAFVLWRIFAGLDVVNLALSRFTINPAAETQIVIEGRKSGLFQWFLAELKLSYMYKIHVRESYISYSIDSAFGERMILTPVQKIASTDCGYRKRISLLIYAVAALFIGLIIALSGIPEGEKTLALMAIAIVAVILVICYIFSKSFYISIYTVGGEDIKLSFKRSSIENVSVNIEKVKEAITRIDELVLAAQ